MERTGGFSWLMLAAPSIVRTPLGGGVRACRWRSPLRLRVVQAAMAFHAEEDGLNIIEIILIIFIAVVILVALAAYFNTNVWAKVKSAIDGLMGTSF